MKTLPLVAASLLLVALAPLAAAEDAASECRWPKYVNDVVVSWEGNTVQVLFHDGAVCQAQVRCGGYTWNCMTIILP